MMEPDSVSWPLATGEIQIIKTQAVYDSGADSSFQFPQSFLRIGSGSISGFRSTPGRDVHHAFCIFHTRFSVRLLAVDAR